MKKFLKRLLGTGLLLLNHPDRVKKTVIDRADDHLDDLGDLAQEKYQSVADIVASRFRRHRDRDEDGHAFRNAVRLAAGVGIGVGLGLLFAPAADKRPGAYSPKKPRPRQRGPEAMSRRWRGIKRICAELGVIPKWRKVPSLS